MNYQIDDVDAAADMSDRLEIEATKSEETDYLAIASQWKKPLSLCLNGDADRIEEESVLANMLSSLAYAAWLAGVRMAGKSIGLGATSRFVDFVQNVQDGDANPVITRAELENAMNDSTGRVDYAIWRSKFPDVDVATLAAHVDTELH